MIGWLAQYDTGCLVGDLVAGVTTALTVIPQGIGYAPLAGLPLQVRQNIKKIHKKKVQKSVKESISTKIFGVFVRWSLLLGNIVACIESSESGNAIFSNKKLRYS